MIVGAYWLDLYCDFPECKAMASITDRETFQDAAREARRRGWMVIRRTFSSPNRVRCPKHVGKQPLNTA